MEGRQLQEFWPLSYITATKAEDDLPNITGLERIGWFIKEGLWVLPHLS